MTSIKPFLCTFIITLIAVSCSRKTSPAGSEIIIIDSPSADTIQTAGMYDSLRIKYAVFLKTNPEYIKNTRLYGFIDEWMGTPYQWGGNSKKGIDCSAFMQRLLFNVYNINIPRTSVQQFHDQWTDRFRSKNHLSEGDLVFFQTMEGKLISHVGLYLANGMFINSSSSKGVSIASLNDPYWKACYVAAGRIKVKKSTAKK
jgi:lipoprotein Spr